MQGNDAQDRDNSARPDAREGDLSDRLQRLDAALKARAGRQSRSESGANAASSAKGMAQALRLASEFAAGVIVGGGLGWIVDRGLGVSPWGLIVFLLLGFAAGVVNVLRSAALMAQSGPPGGGDK